MNPPRTIRPWIGEAFDGVIITTMMPDYARKLSKHLLLTSLDPNLIEFATELRERASEAESGV